MQSDTFVSPELLITVKRGTGICVCVRAVGGPGSPRTSYLRDPFCIWFTFFFALAIVQSISEKCPRVSRREATIGGGNPGVHGNENRKNDCLSAVCEIKSIHE